MKNKSILKKLFLSLLLIAVFLLPRIESTEAAGSTDGKGYQENFTQNGKSCLKKYEGLWENGPAISCFKQVSATCRRNVTKSCIRETRESVYKTIRATCYRTETKYRTISESYRSTCYRTETKYRTISESYRSTCYRSVTVRNPVYGSRRVFRYGRWRTERYFKYYSISTSRQPYTCTKTRSRQVANGTRRVPYSCTKTRSRQVANGTRRVPYSCSKRVFDREKIIRSVYNCVKAETYACKRRVAAVCAGPRTWKSKNKLLSSQCVPDQPSVSLTIDGARETLAKKGQRTTLSFYADEENVDYYEININGSKWSVSSNSYSINTKSLGKGEYTIKVRSCNNELGCSSEKTQDLKIKNHTLPFLD